MFDFGKGIKFLLQRNGFIGQRRFFNQFTRFLVPQLAVPIQFLNKLNAALGNPLVYPVRIVILGVAGIYSKPLLFIMGKEYIGLN